MAEAIVVVPVVAQEEHDTTMKAMDDESNAKKNKDQEDESTSTTIDHDDGTNRETIIVSNMIKLSEISNSILSEFVYLDKKTKTDDKTLNSTTTDAESETNDNKKLDEMMDEAQTALNVIRQYKKQKTTNVRSILKQIISDIQNQGGTFVVTTYEDDPWKSGMIDDGISSKNDQIRGLHLGGDIIENLVSLPLSMFESTTIASSLVTLDLSKSTHLTDLPETIGNLKELRTLNVTRCTSLKHLPNSIGCCLELQHLILTDCEVLSELPDTIGNLTKLRYIKFGANVTSGCNAITKLPDTLGQCISLIELDLTKCKFLQNLPQSIGNLKYLRELNLRECKALHSIPDTIGQCCNLRELSISKCILLKEIPSSITRLQHTLVHLNLSKCTGLPADGVDGLMQIIFSFTNLQILNMRGCKTLTHLSSTLPNDCLQHLQHWDLKGCKKLKELPNNMFSVDVLPSLKMLDLRQCKSLDWSNSIKQEMKQRQSSTCTVLFDEPVVEE